MAGSSPGLGGAGGGGEGGGGLSKRDKALILQRAMQRVSGRGWVMEGGQEEEEGGGGGAEETVGMA